MGLNTRFTVGSVILAILLLSIFGVSRAFRSLASNAPDARQESSRVDTFVASNETDASSRTPSSKDAQIPDVRTRNAAGELEFTPLQTAGTFIQRQQGIEANPTVSDTDVSVLPVADSSAADSPATPAQGNTIPGNPSATPNPNTSTNNPKPNPKPAPSPAVPALW